MLNEELEWTVTLQTQLGMMSDVNDHSFLVRFNHAWIMQYNMFAKERKEFKNEYRLDIEFLSDTDIHIMVARTEIDC